MPWAREGSGFTLLFEALALTLCRELPVNQAARQLRVGARRLWARIGFYIKAARARDDMSAVRHIGVDETSVRKGQAYITVVHDLEARRLLFACPGCDHTALTAFAGELTAHGGDPAAVEHARMDMSGAYAKGVTQALPNARISYDRSHVIALANEAMDAVRREDMRTSPAAVREAVGVADRQGVRRLCWAMRKNPEHWNRQQVDTMHWLQRSNLKSARAWRLKQGLRQVYAQAVARNDESVARQALNAWMSWARRSRLEPYQAPGRHPERPARRRGARHARWPQQRLRRGHERLPATGQGRCPRLPQYGQFHCHRLSQDVQAQASARQPPDPGSAA